MPDAGLVVGYREIPLFSLELLKLILLYHGKCNSLLNDHLGEYVCYFLSKHRRSKSKVGDSLFLFLNPQST